MSDLCGIVSIDKEAGWTSFDVVAKMRCICGVRKIGHAGTLDPAATGVLPVCIGKATKLSSLIGEGVKSYRAGILLGIETDTLDMTGQIVRRADPDALMRVTPEMFEKTVRSFEGGYEQIPPMVSAKHYGGKRLYELAREGQVVERKPVFVRIDEISICEMRLPRAVIEVTCGKGTYIRSLIADIGTELGCGAAMSELTRTRVGRFGLEQSIRIGELEQLAGQGGLDKAVMTVGDYFGDLPEAAVSGHAAEMALNGNELTPEQVPGLQIGSSGRIRICDQDGRLIGIFKPDRKKNRWHPVFMC